MNNVRLLPIVIFAAAALLLFKSFGLVTQGGYVLTGVTSVQAAGGGGGGGQPGTDAVADGGPTMEDESPTLTDPAPTMASAKDAGGGHDAPAKDAGGHDEAAGEQGAADHGGAPSAAAANSKVVCPEPGASGEASAPAEPLPPECAPDAEGVPMAVDKATGQMVPLSDLAAQQSSEQAVIDRLSERRTELDDREKELAMRLALIEAAEKRVAERQAALEALQSQVNALVDQKKAEDDAQFKGLVSMYENMKPKEAARIFNELDMRVLVRLAKAMNARKMAPIMASMDTKRAQQLSADLAASELKGEPSVAPEDLSSLPQIVGQ